MTDGLPSASVIINTIDRAQSLSLLLDSLQLQWFDNPFEVVVVTGPCTDNTLDVVDAWADRIKHVECPEANLSMSRNLGIAASAGEVVVFIDDDAVPEPRWLAELLAPFVEDEEVVATGGYVIDHHGFDLQCRFNRCDRLGRASFDSSRPLDVLSFPGASEFPYVPGGNAAWRRDRLIAIGAFDENYEYYLDEVDVAVRAVDAGWKLHQVPGAAIHHKFLPSAVRGEAKVLKNRFPVLKNKALFGLLNGRQHHTIEEIVGESAHFSAMHRADVLAHLDAGRLSAGALESFDQDSERALVEALEVGLSGARRLGGAVLADSAPDCLRPFPLRQPDGPRRRYVFVSQAIPPDPIGGIGRYMMDAAAGLARQGHEVRVVTDATDHDTIDLEDGVWVHRLAKPDHVTDPTPEHLGEVPPRIWANAVRVEEEVARLNEDHPVDLVYAAVWDTEALAVQARGSAPVVVALVTSLALALESKPSWGTDPEFLEHFAKPMVQVERSFIADADAVHAISSTIIEEIERSSDLSLDRSRVAVEPLGVKDPRLVSEGDHPSGERLREASDEEASLFADDQIRLLFVGRFEKRKGVDLLMEALSIAMVDDPNLHATLIGKADLPGPGGGTWGEWIESTLPAGEWLDRVQVLGEVSDEVLQGAFASSDLFVAPSRFESFGLIYVEAMANSLPFVALARGAANEVVDPSCGLLVEPDAVSLASAIGRLVADPALRRSMGEAGRDRYELLYTDAAMVERIDSMLDGFVESIQHRVASR